MDSYFLSVFFFYFYFFTFIIGLKLQEWRREHTNERYSLKVFIDHTLLMFFFFFFSIFFIDKCKIHKRVQHCFGFLHMFFAPPCFAF